MAYFGELQLNGATYLVGSSLYGTSNTAASSTTKIVSTGILGRDFDELVTGITVNVQFIQGNNIETINLKVGNTTTLPVHGNAKCNPNALLSFTYGKVNGTDSWILNAGEKTATTVMQHYDSSSTEPISGAGVAEAIAPLTGGTSAATLGVDTTIGANPTNDKVPTSAAVAGYVTDAFGRVDAVIYKGTMGLTGDEVNIPTSGYSAGWLYRIVSGGTYAGERCEIGDLILAVHDAGMFQSAANNSHWTVIQKNVVNAVSGPANATTGHVAVFDGNSTTLADGGYTIASNVPANAVFTDTTYEDKGTIQAVVGIEPGNEFTIASTSSGRLHITAGIGLTKATASTGIQEVT